QRRAGTRGRLPGLPSVARGTGGDPRDQLDVSRRHAGRTAARCLRRSGATGKRAPVPAADGCRESRCLGRGMAVGARAVTRAWLPALPAVAMVAGLVGGALAGLAP